MMQLTLKVKVVETIDTHYQGGLEISLDGVDLSHTDETEQADLLEEIATDVLLNHIGDMDVEQVLKALDFDEVKEFVEARSHE